MKSILNLSLSLFLSCDRSGKKSFKRDAPRECAGGERCAKKPAGRVFIVATRYKDYRPRANACEDGRAISSFREASEELREIARDVLYRFIAPLRSTARAGRA